MKKAEIIQTGNVNLNRINTFSLLPNDKEVDQWFEENIGTVNDCSASSAIYKFRLWLKEREENNKHKL